MGLFVRGGTVLTRQRLQRAGGGSTLSLIAPHLPITFAPPSPSPTPPQPMLPYLALKLVGGWGGPPPDAPHFFHTPALPPTPSPCC